MRHIENIVIGTPIVDPAKIFAANSDDWIGSESEKTYYTDERYLPKILVELGIYPSVSEIRRNKPELIRTLDTVDFIEIRPKKKIPLWILIGG